MVKTASAAHVTTAQFIVGVVGQENGQLSGIAQPKASSIESAYTVKTQGYKSEQSAPWTPRYAESVRIRKG